jgi:glyoxylate reductase
VNKKILVADEIRSLLDEIPGDLDVVWIKAEDGLPESGADGLVSLLTRPLGSREMDGVPGLKVIANVATGFDNIDLTEASRRGIVVTNTPDVLTESTADLTLALILAVMRRLPEGIRMLEEGGWTGWDPTQLLGRSLTGATLGIVGGGRIGTAVGRRAIGFGMKVIYTANSVKPALDELGASLVGFDELLKSSDCVTIHAPLNESTRGLIAAPELAMMKPDAVLINTARGGIVDETALLAALDSGQLAGAGLDVFDGEPRVKAELLGHARIVALPHIGSATVETRKAMANLALRNAVAVIEGQPPLTPVVVDGRVGPS